MRRAWILIMLIALCLPFHLAKAQGLSQPSDDEIVISGILFEGNKVTKENIILRELVFSIGDTLKKMELIPAFQQSRENLLNLSIFNFVSLDTEHLPGNRINVLVRVTERWYIWPTPIFEHGERNFSTFIKDPEWSKLNYGLWLKWNNFRGRNELLSAKIRLGYKEQYVLQYEKPNLGASENHKIAFGYSLSRQHRLSLYTLDNKPVYFKEENSYAYNSGDAFVSYTYRPELYSTHKFRLHYRNDWISDSVLILSPEYFGQNRADINYFLFDYVFKYDIRDSKVYPLDGQAYKFKIQRHGLGLIGNYPYGNWELEGNLFLHKKVNNWFYLANVSRGKIASNKELPYFQSKALGYEAFMTSYEDYVIDGTDYFLSKFIAKIQLLKPSTFKVPYIKAKQFNKVHLAIYMNVLADVGYVYSTQALHPSNFMVNELQYSAGLGIDFVTYYDKVFRIEYSINRYGTSGFYFHVETPFFRW